MGGILPSLAHYSAPKNASVPGEICWPEIRLWFGSLRCASFASLKWPILVMPKIRRKLGVESSSWADSQQLNSFSMDLGRQSRLVNHR